MLSLWELWTIPHHRKFVLQGHQEVIMAMGWGCVDKTSTFVHCNMLGWQTRTLLLAQWCSVHNGSQLLLWEDIKQVVYVLSLFTALELLLFPSIKFIIKSYYCHLKLNQFIFTWLICQNWVSSKQNQFKILHLILFLWRIYIYFFLYCLQGFSFVVRKST